MDYFNDIDLNFDGSIDFFEAQKHFGKNLISNAKTYIHAMYSFFSLGGTLDNVTFQNLDVNMDGIISLKEFDEDLAEEYKI